MCEPSQKEVFMATKKRKTKRQSRPRSSSGPSVNVRVHAKQAPIWQTVLKIVLAVLLGITLMGLLLYPVRVFNDTINRIFGIGQQQIDIDAFADTETNTNGGLTREEIAEELANEACPTHSDVSDNIYILDYNDIVCFYKQLKDSDGNTFYPNIVFVKTTDGLKYNGALNMSAKVHYYGEWPWSMRKDITVKQDMYTVPSYTDQRRFSIGYKETNLALLDSSDISFCDSSCTPIQVLTGLFDFGTDGNKKDVLSAVQKYMATYIYPYFLKFCNNQVEIIQDRQSASGDFNAFYDYVYRTAYKHNGTCMVDISSIACYPLPADKQTSYPKGTDGDYFSMYKCNISLVAYYNRTAKSTRYESNESVQKGIEADPITALDLEANPQYITNILLKQNDQHTALTGYQLHQLLVADPITIDIFKGSTKVKPIIFDADSTVSTGLIKSIIGFTKGVYTYQITSNHLIFENTSGAFSVVTNGSLEFAFDYAEGMVAVAVKIEPASGVDCSGVDFATYPTKVIFDSTVNTTRYTYNIDGADKVNTTLTQPIKAGTYTITILSDALEFAQTNYTVTVSNTNNNFTYQFAVKNNNVVIADNLAISVTPIRYALQSGDPYYEYGLLKLSMDATNVNTVKQCITGNVSVAVKVNGTNVITTACPNQYDTLSINLDNVAQSMTAGQAYTISLEFTGTNGTYNLTYNYTHHAHSDTRLILSAQSTGGSA